MGKEGVKKCTNKGSWEVIQKMKKLANMKGEIYQFFLFSLTMLVLLNTVLVLDTSMIAHGASEDITFSSQHIIITVLLIVLCVVAIVGSMFIYIIILEKETRKK
jgi:hypothetical protein